MTTKDSPMAVLKKQADGIAAVLKDAGMFGAKDYTLAHKIKEAKEKGVFKTAIVMDDKIITIEMPWQKIFDTEEAAISEYILNLMREATDAVS
jgi:hypothetical protein